MFPQAELENYKLQVELLQEKLQRSEDNRQQLEHKLDKVLQKRSEFDKCVRQKSRQKYQEFLEEQAKRNERNKKLVQMLERIDEQTAAMSQRSERLKMMKLQYQMYFAKLVQHQTLRSIQQTTAATTAMPVMLQPQAAAISNPTATTAAGVATSAGQLLNPNPTQQQWAYPAQAGMLLAPQFTPQPMYMPMPVPDLYGGMSLGGGQALGTSNLFDLRATLRALDNENADLPERMTRSAAAAAGEYQGDRGATPATSTTTTPCSPTRDKSVARELSSTSSTSLATSSLTFDKLPKTATLTELTETPAAAAASSVVADVADDVGRPQMAGLRRGSQQQQQQQQQQQMEQHQDAWPNSRVTKVEHEKSPSVAGHNEPGQQQQQQHNFEAYFGELKIDEPWQQLPSTTTTAATTRPREDKLELNVRATGNGGGNGNGVGVGLVGGISNDLLDEVKASRAALQKAAAAVDEQLARGNQLSPTATSNISNISNIGNEAAAKPRVSIENIENAIYGERLTGSATATTAAAVVATPTLGLFENAEQELDVDNATHDAAQIDYGQYDAISYGETGEPSYASIEQQQQQQLPSSGAGEPLYSEIGNPTDYQPYAADAANGAATTQELSPADGAEGAAATAGGEAETQQQQEYSNMDYSNYDAAQYAAGYDPNAYPGYIYDETTGQYIADPNAAQYAPDGSYATQDYDAGTANYDYYGEQPQQEQQEQQQQEQQQQQQQQEVAYPMSENNSEAGELLLPQEVEQAAATTATAASLTPADGVDAKSEATPAPSASKPVKPTSILATTDKQAAPNDAHQQQSQQQPQQQQQPKKKKRVNFVDSSETDDSSSAKPVQQETTTTTNSNSNNSNHPQAATTSHPPGGSESDFDFSTGSEAKN
ncbi:probable serine/threonine-protein kinase yakA [Drosophila albomicans]|uniref:Probable serine/threonine-protein kinase yakA n=1 Tax=Drosophila albomicans TaxID=7291 RepID=A0A9C6WH06_DROAB|nr:probable serine/threonine-protein kinase yakA [Drosophila albomicans]